MSEQQRQNVFFDPTPERRHRHLAAPPTDDEIRLSLSENNARCDLNRIIVSTANEGNIRTLRRFLFTMYKRFNRSPRGCSFGIYCPPGQGKTFIVKRFAETAGLPFVFVQSTMLDSTYMLFELMQEACVKAGTPLVPMKTKHADYTAPPMLVFFDEAHTLNRTLMKGGLLNAMEPDDAFMVCKFPGTKGQQFIVDCKDVGWIAATTERGDLFDAFESRLPTPIEWVPASEAELPVIVKAGLDAKVKAKECPFAPTLDVCELICKYQKVPRLAIHGFGVKVIQQKDFMPSDTWEEACKTVANDIGLDEWGMTTRQVAIMSALGQRPIAEGRLPEVARCRINQVKRFELPGLMNYYNGGPFVVSVTGRGMCISRAGLAELDKRRIHHKGERITAEYFESKR